jgi:hypothetical protein
MAGPKPRLSSLPPPPAHQTGFWNAVDDWGRTLRFLTIVITIMVVLFTGTCVLAAVLTHSRFPAELAHGLHSFTRSIGTIGGVRGGLLTLGAVAAASGRLTWFIVHRRLGVKVGREGLQAGDDRGQEETE